MKTGYYLINNDEYHYISKSVSVSALERVANRVLSDDNFDYWIDYCLGLDVKGNSAFTNLDHTDKFI